MAKSQESTGTPTSTKPPAPVASEPVPAPKTPIEILFPDLKAMKIDPDGMRLRSNTIGDVIHVRCMCSYVGTSINKTKATKDVIAFLETQDELTKDWQDQQIESKKKLRKNKFETADK